jgi:hypothetical protein
VALEPKLDTEGQEIKNGVKVLRMHFLLKLIQGTGFRWIRRTTKKVDLIFTMIQTAGTTVGSTYGCQIASLI